MASHLASLRKWDFWNSEMAYYKLLLKLSECFIQNIVAKSCQFDAA